MSIVFIKIKCECVRLQVHGQKSVWEDPVEWVRGSLPWPSAQQDQAKLFHLPPPSTGPGSPSQPGDERTHKETPPSSVDSDPLVSAVFGSVWIRAVSIIKQSFKYHI